MVDRRFPFFSGAQHAANARRAGVGVSLPGGGETTFGALVRMVPEDILFHVLTWLPAKSLCRFRCVSKRWRAARCHRRVRRALEVRRAVTAGRASCVCWTPRTAAWSGWSRTSGAGGCRARASTPPVSTPAIAAPPPSTRRRGGPSRSAASLTTPRPATPASATTASAALPRPACTTVQGCPPRPCSRGAGGSNNNGPRRHARRRRRRQ